MQTSITRCALLDGCFWLLTVLNTFEDVPKQSPLITDLIRGVTVDLLIKDLSPLHLALFVAQRQYATQTRIIFLCLSGCGMGNSNVYNKSFPAMFG